MAERKGESMLRSFARKQAQQFNASPVSQAFTRDLERNFSAVAEALAVPGKAVRGEYNDRSLYSDGSISPVSEALIGDAAKLAGLAATGGMPMPRPVSSLGMFGGMGARTADLPALNRAQALEAAGATADDIIRTTGWFKGADGKWRFEIDDSAMQFSAPEDTSAFMRGEKLKLGDYVSHPELAAAYPELLNSPAQHMNLGVVGPGTLGGYAPEVGYLFNENYIPSPTDAARLGPRQAQRLNDQGRSTALHEIQHQVQDIEGFAAGGSPEMLAGKYADSLAAYRALMGEVESRNVQSRMNMTQTERQNRAPWETQDTPNPKQIKR